MDVLIVLLIILVAAGVFGVILYNRLVALRQERSNAFADIDVQLKLRSDLIPNLIETVKGYTNHERELLEQVTEARARATQANSTHDRAVAEGALGVALTRLIAVAENYPDLKASENFTNLQNELSDIENKIASARRYFNNATSEYNIATEQFPAVIVARMFHFNKADFFDVGEEERARMDEPPRVSFS